MCCRNSRNNIEHVQYVFSKYNSAGFSLFEQTNSEQFLNTQYKNSEYDWLRVLQVRVSVVGGDGLMTVFCSSINTSTCVYILFSRQNV